MALAVILLAAVALAGYLAFQAPDYSPLFTRLDERDAGAIVDKLREMNVPYRLSDGGGTVLVPSAQVHETRLRLAGEGLPASGSVGFELFNQPNLGATDFTQRLNYQRALEGELARTISRLQGVEQARVHLVLPQPTLFVEQQQPATASVVLQLRGASEPTQEQVRGVVHLVATSVEGLAPERITLVDTRGRVLASGAGNDGAGSLGATATQLELQRSYERHIVSNVQALLDRTLGPGRGIVSASVLLDWDRFEANSEIFSPGDAPAQVRSAREVVETARNEAAEAAGGVPGVEANVATYQQVGPGGNSESERRETVTNYELSKTVERITRVPGSVRRVSVSVMLDAGIPAEQVAQFERAVPAAVGLDAARGDVVEIASVPFDRTFFEAEQAAMDEARRQEETEQLINIARANVPPLLGLLVLAIMFFAVLRRQPVVQRRLAAPGPVITEVVQDPAVVEEFQRRRALRDQVSGLAREDPQAISQVIKTWLVEDGSES